MNRFGKTPVPADHILIGGILARSVGITRGDILNSGNAGHIGLHPPEAAACQIQAPQIFLRYSHAFDRAGGRSSCIALTSAAAGRHGHNQGKEA
ncbi:hypothetical protein D3C76_1529370 [compost metagenome]